MDDHSPQSEVDTRPLPNHSDPSPGTLLSPGTGSGEHEPLLGSGSGAKPIYRVYGKRWFVLGVLALINISNGMMWISFSPIADTVAEYYHINATKVNMLSVIFMIVTIPLGIFSVWLLDVWGLRSAIILSSWLNLLGAILRVVSCLGIPPSLRYPVLLGGQTLVALGQPFVMFAPTKIAGLWFAADQRAVANTIATVANPLGIMVGNLLSPAIVKPPGNLLLLNYLYGAPAVLAAVLATGGVWRSVPPTPPSASAAQPSEPFLLGIKHLLCNGYYWLLALSFGSSIALFTVFNTLVEQILCPLGYTDTFAGWCGALMIAVGLLGAAVAAVYVDKTKNFVEVAKIGVSLATISLIGFVVVSRYAHMQVILVTLSALVGFFGFASNPVCLELSVECTYPVAEATSAGLMIISSQIQSLVLILLMEAFARPYDLNMVPHQVCHMKGVMGMLPQDYTIPNLGLCVLGALVCIIFTAAFKCDFKRMRAEQMEAAEQIINDSTGESSGPSGILNSYMEPDTRHGDHMETDRINRNGTTTYGTNTHIS